MGRTSANGEPRLVDPNETAVRGQEEGPRPLQLGHRRLLEADRSKARSICLRRSRRQRRADNKTACPARTGVGGEHRPRSSEVRSGHTRCAGTRRCSSIARRATSAASASASRISPPSQCWRRVHPPDRRRHERENSNINGTGVISFIFLGAQTDTLGHCLVRIGRNICLRAVRVALGASERSPRPTRSIPKPRVAAFSRSLRASLSLPATSRLLARFT